MSQPDLLDVAKGWCQLKGLTLDGRAGQGSFKETFRVRDSGGQELALKIYKSDPTNERSRREIDAIQRCNHPNLARLISVGAFEYDGRTYGYAMEPFIEGGTLGDRLASSVLSRDEVLVLGERLISALIHIQELALVHRDIKPDNIMLNGGRVENPILVDFGLVRDLNADSLTHTFLPAGPGTPLFSSPEQLNNDKDMIGCQSDQFSLGISLTVGCLGIHPFDDTESNLLQQLKANRGNNLAAIVGRIASHNEVVPSVAKKLREVHLPVVLSLLKPWPIQRFATAKALADAWVSQSGVG